jgi:glutamyl-Q tRNA(Asp) synthetase
MGETRVPTGRFAPSPTGPLHAGSLVAAVGSFVLARQAGGRWLVRMEDIDRPRVVSGMAEDILRTLECLGLEWDGPVVYQSERTEAYEAALANLLDLGAAFACGCTRKDLRQAASAPHAPPHVEDEEPVYPGTCREGLPPGREARAVRVRTEGGSIDFADRIQGPQSWNLAETSGDFVIARADGIFAYQLAVVVDDAEAGVTQVVRGADLLASTARQIHLQRLLSLPTPEYGHLPLVAGPGGQKLSKRDNAVSLAHGGNLFANGGRLIHGALTFLGQKVPAELAGATASELLAWAVARFDAAAVPRSPSPFS